MHSIRSHDKMVGLGCVYTLGKQISHSSERCTSQNATSAEFLEVQIPPHVLVYDFVGVLCQALEVRKNLMGRIRR